MAAVEALDPGLFLRTFKQQTTRIVPNVILIPGYGETGICWEPFEKFNRSTSRGRIAIPLYPTKSLRLAVIAAMARPALAGRQGEGAVLLDGGGHHRASTTSGSTEKKLRGDVREYFIRDYILWITMESQGMQKLDRDVRGIFWRLMPFPQETKDSAEEPRLLLQRAVQERPEHRPLRRVLDRRSTPSVRHATLAGRRTSHGNVRYRHIPDARRAARAAGHPVASVQSKELGQGLATYHVGDVVAECPVVTGILEEMLWCAACRAMDHKVYVTIWHSLITGVYRDGAEAEARLLAVDRADILNHLVVHQRERWRLRRNLGTLLSLLEAYAEYLAADDKAAFLGAPLGGIGRWELKDHLGEKDPLASIVTKYRAEIGEDASGWF